MAKVIIFGETMLAFLILIAAAVSVLSDLLLRHPSQSSTVSEDDDGVLLKMRPSRSSETIVHYANKICHISPRSVELRPP
jgi:hypothetical protein